MPVVAGIAQPDGPGHRVALLVMGPVEHHGELPVVHAFAGEFNLLGPGLGVLPEVALLGLPAHGHEVVRSPDQVEGRHIGEVLDGVVGTVQGAPALDAKQVAPLIEVPVEERPRVFIIGPDQFAFQQGPRRWWHGGGDRNRGVPRHGLLPVRQVGWIVRCGRPAARKVKHGRLGARNELAWSPWGAERKVRSPEIRRTARTYTPRERVSTASWKDGRVAREQRLRVSTAASGVNGSPGRGGVVREPRPRVSATTSTVDRSLERGGAVREPEC